MNLDTIIPGINCPLSVDDDTSASELRDLVTEEAMAEILRTIVADNLIRSTLTPKQLTHVIDEAFHSTELRSHAWKLVDAMLHAEDL